MELPALRIRLTFEDSSVLTLAQRSNGMNNSWILIEPNQLPKISDLCTHLLHYFNLLSSCRNGILLFMEGFVLPPCESTRILKDKDIICVKRKGMPLAEAVEGADACNLINEEVNRREPVDNGTLLLANEEFDEETGGCQSEYEDAEVKKSEDEPLPKETSSKKRKASTRLQTSKKKKHRLVATHGVEDKVPAEDNDINDYECFPKNKKTKPNKEKRNGESETITVKVKSPKVKRKKKHCLGVVIGDEDDANDGKSILNEKIGKKTKPQEEKSGVSETITVNVKSPKVKRKKKHGLGVVISGEDDANNGKSILNEKINKKTKPHEEIKNANAETSVEGAEHMSSAPDGDKKGPSRSARRKKAKRRWRRELAISAQNPFNTHVVPEIPRTENKEVAGHPEGPDQVPAKVTHENIIEQGRNHNDNGVTKYVPCVVKPGHIRFEPLDEDEDTKQIEVSDVAFSFQWNGIISKKKGQKWGLEKFSTYKRDDFQQATIEPSTKLTVDPQVPLIDPIAFDQLPLCSSPKEGDVIVYRVLELSSSWTPELSSFRVGKISYYDADNIVLMPVPEYPIVLDKMDETGPDNSLYKEDGSLEIKFAALADVRSLEQSNSDAVKAVSNGVIQTAQVDEKNTASKYAVKAVSNRINQTAQVDVKNTASNLMSSSNDKEKLSKNPSPAQPAVGNKEGNTWAELEEILNAKKSELLETNEEMKRDSVWNKWSYRALRGSALGPAISLLRSKNDI